MYFLSSLMDEFNQLSSVSKMKRSRFTLFLLLSLTFQDISFGANLIARTKRTLFLAPSPCLGVSGQKSPISRQLTQRILPTNHSQEVNLEETTTEPNSTAKVRVKRVITISFGAPGLGGCGGGCDGGCGGAPAFSRLKQRRRQSENIKLESGSSSGLNEEKKRIKYMVIPSPFLTSLLTMGRVGIQERQPLLKKSNRLFQRLSTREPVTSGTYSFP